MLERLVDEARVLHVEADEVAERRRVVDEALDVRVGELLVEQEAEVRQLERDVARAGRARRCRRGSASYSSVTARASLGREDVLAEQRRVGVEPALVQPREHLGALVERLAGHEALRAEAHAVLAHDAPDALAARRGEDALAAACR